MLRRKATEIWTAGVDAVRAAPLVSREVRVTADELQVGEHVWSKKDFDRVLVVGAGKAGAAMALGLLQSIGDWLPVSGWLNVPAGTETLDLPLNGIQLHAARPAGVNEPTIEGVEGTRRIMQLVREAGPRDLCIALISGGGSALLPAPIAGISLADKQQVTRFLSGAGADIAELNTVRKHLSDVKGGGLLRACRAAELITLVLSDVLGDPLDLIASGPTVLDPSTPADALAVLARFDPEHELSANIYQALSQASVAAEAGAESQTRSTTIVIGNNAVAVDEAGICAEGLGFNHAMQSARTCEGSAEAVGQRLAEMTVQMLRADPSSHRTDCLITGGEPTVILAPVDQRGKGGRNQQLVLAAYQYLLSQELSDEEWSRLCILSGGTDGEDGPTDAAGAVIDHQLHLHAESKRLDPADYLRRNDAYRFFDAIGGLILTGPTGTNVCDLRVAVVAAKNL
ncbi:MAG: glycerate kinase [Rubripirellula sp.]